LFIGLFLRGGEKKELLNPKEKTERGAVGASVWVTFEIKYFWIMKKIFTLVVAAMLGSTVGSFAQQIEFIEPVTTVTGTLAEIGPLGELEAAWGVRNISEETLSWRCRREIVSNVTGATNYFCWGVCFMENTDVSPAGIAVSIGPGEINNSFYAHYKPNNNAGMSTIRYCFFNLDNNAEELCYTVNFCVDAECLVGVEEKQEVATTTAVKPNPVSDFGAISYNINRHFNQANLFVYNSVGQVVKQEILQNKQGLLVFDASEFANGLYTYSIAVDGVMSPMQKLVVQH
jgi:hypothetical protein